MPERRRVPVDQPKPSFTPESFKGAIDLVRTPATAECDCPRLDREDWHEVESDWSDITFVKTGMNAVMGVPVGYPGAKVELIKKGLQLGATVPDDAMVLLGEGTMRRPVMLEVEDVPEGARDVVRPGGVVFTRLVPAPLGEMKKAVSETKSIAQERYGRAPDAIWIWYLTCRVCSSPREFETLVLAHYRQAPK